MVLIAIHRNYVIGERFYSEYNDDRHSMVSMLGVFQVAEVLPNWCEFTFPIKPPEQVFQK